MLEMNILERAAVRDPAHDHGSRRRAHNPVFVNLAALGFARAPHGAEAIFVNELLQIELRSNTIAHTCEFSGQPATFKPWQRRKQWVVMWRTTRTSAMQQRSPRHRSTSHRARTVIPR